MQTTLSFGSQGLTAAAPQPSSALKAAGKKRALRPQDAGAPKADGKRQAAAAAPAAAAAEAERLMAQLTETEKRRVILAEMDHERHMGVFSIVPGHGSERTRNMEALMLQKYANRKARQAQGPPARSSKAGSGARPSEGWRRLPDGSSAYVTAAGKRLSGPAAFAASSRAKR